MPVRIITDGSCDLPKHLITELGLRVVPLNVHFQDGVYAIDPLQDQTPFFQKLREESELPKTSSPSPHAFLQAYQEVDPDDDILVITLSSQLSSTYQHAEMGKALFLEEQPHRRIEVIDSKNASIGLALIVYQVARKAKSGLPFEELVDYACRCVKETLTLFFLETVENLIKGGRLDRVRGKIATVLNIKLLMRGSAEGTIEVVEKVRGTQKAIQRLVELVGEYGKNFEHKILGIAHGNCEAKARQVIEMLKARYPFQEILLSEMGPAIATHAGEGGIICSFPGLFPNE